MTSRLMAVRFHLAMNFQEILSALSVRSYNYIEPLKIGTFSSVKGLFGDILESAAFRRLDSIRFLGGIDYAWVRSPNGAPTNVRYTRAQHSVGVAMLALHYIEKIGATERDAKAIFVAALLHDIGHAPLSHSLEPVFEVEFGLTHHRATEDIVRGDVSLGRDLYDTLVEHGVDVGQVIELMAGQHSGILGFFGGPINFDTIEGISRSRKYAGLPNAYSQPLTIVDAAINRSSNRDRDVVDEFWRQKGEVYRYIIGSRTGVLADFACQHFMRKFIHKFTREDYFTTEECAFKKLPGLYHLLTAKTFEFEVWHLIKEPVLYTARTFFIDECVDFLRRDDVRRYKQSKQLRVIEPRRIRSNNLEPTKDLFDDHPL